MTTIHDVARAAGVSISTVSRALAAPDMVAAKTRQRVQHAADELGYRPNPNARSLITGRTCCIGLVVPDLENPFFASVCKGVQDQARRSGYTVFVADTDEDPALEGEIVQNMISQVDGVILCSARGKDSAIRGLTAPKPLILLNRRLRGLPSIVFDDAAGAALLLGHLSELGHRRIAYASGPASSRSNRERQRAFEAYGAAHGDLDLVVLGPFPPYFSGGQQVAAILTDSGATAVLAFNDLMALGIIDALGRADISVPQEISVTGFDNVALATLGRPQLTTVDLPRIQMGRLGVDWLLDIVLDRSPHPGSLRQMAVDLVVRESTAPVHTSRPRPRRRSKQIVR